MSRKDSSPSGLLPLRLALDWTPNTIHTGLFLALKEGLYQRVGLDVVLSQPSPSYDLSPAKRLVSHEVDLAIVPSESIIAYHHSQHIASPTSTTLTNPPQLKAIYAILQQDASAIATTNPDITHFSHLSTGVYGSYNARYEDAIVRHMLAHAGGNPSTLSIDHTSPKLSLFDRVKSRHLDATWIFTPWEGVDADLAGVKYTAFRPGDYGVEYGYSPVICYDAGHASTRLSAEVLSRFVRATREGYVLAMQRGADAGMVLLDECQPARSEHFLRTSQQAINRYYISDGRHGDNNDDKKGKDNNNSDHEHVNDNRNDQLAKNGNDSSSDDNQINLNHNLNRGTNTDTPSEKNNHPVPQKNKKTQTSTDKDTDTGTSTSTGTGTETNTQIQSQPASQSHFATESHPEIGEIGTMHPSKWRRWVTWLSNRGLLVHPINDVDELYTDEFF